jgi:hypothetical protein
LGNLQRTYRRSWVDVTVRFNHPLAQECVGRGPKKLGRPTRKEAIAWCRGQPVVVSIHRAVALPATDTAAGCPASQPISMDEVWRLWRLGAPAGSTKWEGSDAGLRRCFHARPFRIRAYLPTADITDPGLWVGAPKPWWWHYSRITIFSTTRTNRWGEPKDPTYVITVPPAFERLHKMYGGSWVVVTVRFNDPRAERCRPAGPRSARGTKREAIAYCRAQLVLQAIDRDAPLPPTDTAGPAAGRSDAPGTIRAIGQSVAVVRAARFADPPATAHETPGRTVPGGGGPWLLVAALVGGAIGWRRLSRRLR